MLNLSNADLNALAPEVSAPTYDRTQRRSGIAHVGAGHFHRSRQAMYVDRLMRSATSTKKPFRRSSRFQAPT